MRRSLVAGLVAVAVGVGAVGLAAGPASADSRSEQVVFSGTGAGSFGGMDTPFGFWIWCESSSQNPYNGICWGSMYFYELGLVKGVHGTVTEPAEDQYQMSVVSNTDSSVACTLTNDPPITRGPTNEVDVSCSSPSGSGTSTNAVVTSNG